MKRPYIDEYDRAHIRDGSPIIRDIAMRRLAMAHIRRDIDTSRLMRYVKFSTEWTAKQFKYILGVRG